MDIHTLVLSFCAQQSCPAHNARSKDAILTVAAALEPAPSLAPAAPEPVHTLAPSDPAHLGWSVRKAPFAGQGACGKEGTKWQCVLEESSRVQGAASHMGRGARGKMHASRCAHRGVRARKKLAQTTQSGNKVGNPLWIPFSVLRKNWFPVRFSLSDFRSDFGFRRVSRFDSRFQL